MSEKEYIPFGDEWVKECMKLRKADLVAILRNALTQVWKIDHPELAAVGRIQFADMQSEANLLSLMKWTAGAGFLAVFTGPPMSGKTRLWQALFKGRQVISVRMRDVISRHVLERTPGAVIISEGFGENMKKPFFKDWVLEAVGNGRQVVLIDHELVLAPELEKIALRVRLKGE